MDISPIYEDLITDLVASKEGLLPYSLYQRYQIQPSKLAKFLSDMIEKGLVRLEGDMIVATAEGIESFKDFIPEQSSVIVKKSSSSYFKHKQIATRIKVNEPFMPSAETIFNIIQDREKETSSKE